jgi:hypothetical protein
MSRQQMAARGRNIHMVNETFENVSKAEMFGNDTTSKLHLQRSGTD